MSVAAGPAEVLDRVSRMPAMQRMKELLALDRVIDARREWWHSEKRLDAAETLARAARIYADWGWRDRAIFTAARADYWDDLETALSADAHRHRGQEYATDRALDPAGSSAYCARRAPSWPTCARPQAPWG